MANRAHTEQIPHFQFHVLNQFTYVHNVTRIIRDWHILFNLSRHVSTQIHIS